MLYFPPLISDVIILTTLLVSFHSNAAHPAAEEQQQNELSFSECLALERYSLLLPSGYSSASAAGSGAKMVSVREGNPAYLHCPIGGQIGGANVLKAAWYRMRDQALLTVGADKFTQDLRFQVSRPRESEPDDWVLILRRAELDDAGCYLCDINTEPVNTLLPVYLKVTSKRETHNDVLGRKRKGQQEQQNGEEENKRNAHLQTRMDGSTLVLNCTVDKVPQIGADQTKSIVWSRDSRPLDLSDKRYETDFRASDRQDLLVYTLRVREARPDRDGGVYACEGDQLARAAEIVTLRGNMFAGSSTSSAGGGQKGMAIEGMGWAICTILLLYLRAMVNGAE